MTPSLTGQVPTHLIGNDAFQEADTVGITRPCTKHNYLVKDVDDLARIMAEAFYVARSGRPGPVVVDLPKDVVNDTAEYERTVGELAHFVGLDRVRCIHVNDSKRECGSRVDRHEHIGKGKIGRGAFVRLVNDKRFAALPMILETPKDKDGRGSPWDKVNLNRLRRMVER